MGNIVPNQMCCTTNLCKNDKEFHDDVKLPTSYSSLSSNNNNIKKIILIQKHARRFLVKNRLNLISNNNIQLLNRTNEPSFDMGCAPGTILFHNSEPPLTNQTVLKLENSLGKFEMTEKENFIISFSNLKKYSVLYKDNSFYKGLFNKYWKKEGYGILYFPDGSKYEGFFHNDFMWGRGRLINVNGFYYEGNFHNNQANGFGKYVAADGAVYIGYWKNDKQHGLGEEVYPDGSQFEGQFENGKKHGKGIFIFQDNSKYEGEFENNIIQGYGIYTWTDGRIFQGTWVDNNMEGKGVFIWPDRKKYIGEYLNDKKHGYGIFIWPDGKKFEGMWQNGKQNGFGILISNSKTYYGEWVDGKKVRSIEKTDTEYEEMIKLLNNHRIQSNINELHDPKSSKG
jgi:hypothetical protein